MRVWAKTLICLLQLLFLFVFLVCNHSPACAQEEGAEKPSAESPIGQAEAAVEKLEGEPSDSVAVEELLTELRKLDQKKARKHGERVQKWKLQVELANRVISQSKEEEFTREASLRLIRAAKALYGLDYLGKLNSPTADQEFKASYFQFLDSSDGEIIREAHFSRLVHSMFRGMEGNEDAEAVLKTMKKLLSRFEGEPAMENKVGLLFKSCIEIDIEFAKQLGQEFDEGNGGDHHFLQEMFGSHLAY